MFAEPLLAGGEERYGGGDREYQHQYNNHHMEKGARQYQDPEPEDREVTICTWGRASYWLLLLVPSCTFLYCMYRMKSVWSWEHFSLEN